VTHSVLLLVLDGLATYRLTQLVTSDTLTQPIRDLFQRTEWGAEFVGCAWCVSIWAAGLVVVLQSSIGHVWFYAACVLALSAVTGLLSEVV